MDNLKTGEVICKRRKELGLTQNQLAGIRREKLHQVKADPVWDQPPVIFLGTVAPVIIRYQAACSTSSLPLTAKSFVTASRLTPL